MILYFTYNDQPSGVYYSQVCDVVDYMDQLPGEQVRLFALVSARGWWGIRKQIRSRSPKAIVWPMVPRAKNWKWNVCLLGLLCLIKRPSGILARGVFASALAMTIGKRGLCTNVAFDGRGAYAAEWREYRIIDDESLIAQVAPLEKKVVNNSNFRLAVSEALVKYWRSEYGYDGQDHVIIPCTLSAGREFSLEVAHISAMRNQMALAESDIVLAYAGSTAGWQSFGLLDRLFEPLMQDQSNVKLLFLSQMTEDLESLVTKYPGRVDVKWLKPEKVHGVLSACDYGILVREQADTNRVASPTKFAEYLAAGLQVIISEGVGDMSGETVEQHLGAVWRDGQRIAPLNRTSMSQKATLHKYAMDHYSKIAKRGDYLRLKEALKR